MGLRNALIQYRQIEISRAIENIVYIELLRRGYLVDIGKNRNEEIDFIAVDTEGRRNYIQVSLSIETPNVKERELSSFRGLDAACPYREFLLCINKSTNLPVNLLHYKPKEKRPCKKLFSVPGALRKKRRPSIH